MIKSAERVALAFLVSLAFFALPACTNYQSPPQLGSVSPMDPSAKQDWDSMHGPK